MFCKNCGKEIEDTANVCTYCGTPQKEGGTTMPSMNSDDSGNFGWSILGCCIPIVGLILFLVWNKEKPNTAKKAGIGALVGVAFSILFYVVIFVIGIGSASMGYYF